MKIDQYRKMALDLSKFDLSISKIDGFEIKELEPEYIDAWFGIYASCFDLSWEIEKSLKEYYKELFLAKENTKIYLGIYKGRIVAIAQIYFDANSAGIYNIETLPEARNKGIGTAMTTKLLIDAKIAQYELATLQATKHGYPIYKKLGFIETGTSECFVKLMGKTKLYGPFAYIGRIISNTIRQQIIKI